MKKLLITFLFVGGILLLYWGIGGFPIVFDNSPQVIPLAKLNSGTFNPLEGMSLDTGENKVILLLSFDDIIELPSNVCKRKVLVCSDNSILKQLQNNFDFKISGGDMATANAAANASKGYNYGNKTGTKSDNKLKPSSEATGDHRSFKTDGKGKITNTATYKQNPKNPSGFDEVKRVDVTGKKHNGVNTPHVHEPKQRVRPAKPDELPKQK